MTIESPRAIAYDLVQDWLRTWASISVPRNARADLADRIAAAIDADRANTRNAVLQRAADALAACEEEKS